MITREEYERAKKVVEKYEMNEFIEEQRRADQILEDMELEDDEEDDDYGEPCKHCGFYSGQHEDDCPDSED